MALSLIMRTTAVISGCFPLLSSTSTLIFAENVLKSIEINNFYNTGDLLYVESYGKKANHPFVQKKTVYFVSNKTKINSLVKKMPEPKARSPG